MNEPAGLKLLIVDDSARVRRLIKSMVAGLACEVQECGDGAEALPVYNVHRPDFVLMDIQMGRTDGITTTRRIKEADPPARIIIVTDDDQADLREAARRAGACAYVVKENLLELVRLLQGRPRATDC
ncbi:MAG TPA: response regulator [Terriglobia bacterium]|nr:response regulator [Terriglobia bacterium]